MFLSIIKAWKRFKQFQIFNKVFNEYLLNKLIEYVEKNWIFLLFLK